MADSLVIDFLDENSYRSYPFVEAISRSGGNGYSLTNDVVLDAQIFSNTQTGLTQIVANTSTVTFAVAGDTFVASVVGTFPQYIRNANGNLLVVGVGALNIPAGTYTFTNVSLEPSVVYEFAAEWLGVSEVIFNSVGITGDVVFADGFQFDVEASGSVVTLSAGSLYGYPIGCTSFSSIPANCSEIISFINGVGPSGSGKLNIDAGSGVIVIDDPDNHRIFIGLEFGSDDICATPPTINPAI